MKYTFVCAKQNQIGKRNSYSCLHDQQGAMPLKAANSKLEPNSQSPHIPALPRGSKIYIEYLEY